MPSLNTRDLERCLLTKLRAIERRAGDHRVFDLFDLEGELEGELVATTRLSRSWRGSTPLGPAMVAAIRREIGLRSDSAAFQRLVACPLTREEYLALASQADADG